MDHDSFFSINAFWHPTKDDLLSAPESRQSGRLRYLCAAFADLDFHNLGLDFGAALAAIVRFQDENTIPPASAIVRSGRGMWLLWFLHDPKFPGMPPRAFPEKLRLYNEVNRAIFSRLANLGADSGARDAIRLMRVPGSLNPRAMTAPRVRFWLQAGDDGRPYSYTLHDLVRWFGVGKPESAHDEEVQPPPVGPRKIRPGFRPTNARRLQEVAALRTLRGGFREGCRNRAVLIYAWLLRISRLPCVSILREAQKIGAECKPPLSDAEIRQAVKTATNPSLLRLRDQTISDWLDVTPAESAQLEKLPASSRFSKPTGERKLSRREIRRAAMCQILQERWPDTPGCREMAELLGAKQIQVSHMQVARDYREMRRDGRTSL